MTKSVMMKGLSGEEVAGHFMNAWVFNYCAPAELISYNGGCFTSNIFSDLCNIMSIKNSFTTTYHLQSNGQCERYKRKILTALRTNRGIIPSIAIHIRTH